MSTTEQRKLTSYDLPPKLDPAYERAADEQWMPRIGDAVVASPSFLQRYGEWEGVKLFVCGLNFDRTSGINVTVCEQWPPEPGTTDGFYIYLPHSPDDLMPSTHSKEGE